MASKDDDQSGSEKWYEVADNFEEDPTANDGQSRGPYTGFVIALILGSMVFIALVCAGAIFFSFIAPTVVLQQGQVASVKADFRLLQTACEQFRLDHGRWPENLGELIEPPPVTNGRKPTTYRSVPTTYLSEVPLDPWSEQPYLMRFAESGEPYFVFHGADQAEGGVDADADVESRGE